MLIPAAGAEMRACWLVLPPGTRLTAAVLHSAVGRSPVCDGAVPQAWGQDNTWSSPDGCIITHITATPDPDAVYNITVRCVSVPCACYQIPTAHVCSLDMFWACGHVFPA